MNRTLYTLLLFLLIPFFVLRLFWRSRKNPDYRARLGERFARKTSWPVRPAAATLIHVHAVSVGEVHAAEPLVKRMLEQWSDVSVLITTTTPTGSERVGKLFGDRVLHVYLPYDLPGMMSAFLDYFTPQLIVLLETELWPNLLFQAKSRQIRLALVNARLSAKSATGYGRLGTLVKEMLDQLDLVCVQSPADYQRFVLLGLDESRAVQIPSLKYDIEVPGSLVSSGHALRQELFGQRPVVIAASTRQGEDELVLDAFCELRKSVPDVAMVLVPRHPERVPDVEVLVRSRRLEVLRKSRADADSMPAAPDVAVLIGDTMGEMFMYLSLADVAFVGGSLVQTGCQNILEPAAMSLPVITGPSLFNFQHVSEGLRENGGQQVVENPAELAQAWQKLLGDESSRQEAGDRARQVFERFGGGSERILKALATLLG